MSAPLERAGIVPRPDPDVGTNAHGSARYRPRPDAEWALTFSVFRRSASDRYTGEEKSRSPMTTTTLSGEAEPCVGRPVLANVATVDAAGHPQLTPVWIDLDGGGIMLNTARGHVKDRNLSRGPRLLAVSIVDPDDPYNVLVMRGTVDATGGRGRRPHRLVGQKIHWGWTPTRCGDQARSNVPGAPRGRRHAGARAPEDRGLDRPLVPGPARPRLPCTTCRALCPPR